LVKLIGFRIEPAKVHELTGRLCHRVWVDSDDSALPSIAGHGRLLN